MAQVFNIASKGLMIVGGLALIGNLTGTFGAVSAGAGTIWSGISSIPGMFGMGGPA